LTPGTLINRRICPDSSASCAISRFDRCDLCVEELDLVHRSVDGLALLRRQLQTGEPAAALDTEAV